MNTALRRNRHQKAAHRPGEARISRSQVDELLSLSRSEDADERLTAARFLCPCHVRGRNPQIWNAVFRLMADGDRRVRLAAWHTLEDGGLPPEREAMDRLEVLFRQELDAGVRALAEEHFGFALAERDRRELAKMRLPSSRSRGKCDFCGERDVVVERDLETMVPTSDLPRPALVCARCAATRR